jgi:hypothetical protein
VSFSIMRKDSRAENSGVLHAEQGVFGSSTQV